MAEKSFINVCPHDPMNCYRNSSESPLKRRFIVVIACIIFLSTLIAIIFVASNRQDDFKHAGLPYASFKSALNISVDPCVDFYNFSCGLWTGSSDSKDNPNSANSFDLVQKKIDTIKKAVFENVKENKTFPRAVNNAIRFYRTCVSQNFPNNIGIGQLLQYLDAIGGWPILNKSKWNATLFDWFHASAFLIKNFDVHPVIGVYSADAAKSEGRNVIYLKSPLALEDPDFVLYGDYNMFMLYCIVESLNNSVITYQNFEEGFLRLQNVSAKYSELLRTPKKEFNPVYLSIEKLTEQIPEIDWLKYFQLIMNDTLNGINKTLTPDDIVAVDDFDFLRNALAVVMSDMFSKEDLADLFGWLVVKDIWILLPDVFKNYANISLYDSDDSLTIASDRCFDLTSSLFSCSLDYIFIKNLSHAGIEDNTVLIKYLRSAFEDIVQKSVWLDGESEKRMLKRLSEMKEIIGFPSYLNNKTEFDEMYKDFPLMDEFSLGYYIQIKQFYIKKRIKSLKVPSDKNYVLPRSVSDVSAYFFANKNTFVIPLSLHNPPFYYHNGPWYLNFGALGPMVSHEIMHGFDTIGPNGVELNVTWLTDSAKELYKKRAMCFKKQYDVFENSGLYKNNGTRTLRENIADTEGLHIAFEAYKKHAKLTKPEYEYNVMNNYNSEQMFFIAYATMWCAKSDSARKKRLLTDSHSLPDVRVNKAVSNIKQFAEVFNCPTGSPMNPTDRCSVW